MSENRKIAAILVADVVGYSRLAGADEEGTLARLRVLRSDLIDPTIAVHKGRVVERTGDGLLVEFRSVVDAEYGIMGSFASAADRDAFYEPALFKDWLARIEPMVEGKSARRQLDGLEAWFRDGKEPLPPRLLTWVAVWPASMLTRAILTPALGPNVPQVVEAGLVAAGVVMILTWAAMPFLVRMAHPWLRPKSPQQL
jgi:antibiotic biosynthesis monooxygenase (ABM) superfamily enzyme